MPELLPTDIAPGDVVRLKSGGPEMTVRWVGDQWGTLSVNCDWFIQDRAPWKAENATFPVTSVEKA